VQFDHIGVPAPAIAEPFDVFGQVRVGFIEVDGAPVEFVQPY
jgi:hypothetical protein